MTEVPCEVCGSKPATTRWPLKGGGSQDVCEDCHLVLGVAFGDAQEDWLGVEGYHNKVADNRLRRRPSSVPDTRYDG